MNISLIIYLSIGYLNVSKSLIDHGADVNVIGGVVETFILHRAALKGNCVKLRKTDFVEIWIWFQVT